ncbi:hypothetical protein WDU94_011000, partial [Cyamophila willieti]
MCQKQLQGVSKCRVILAVVALITLVQGGPFELDAMVDGSFDPHYLENYLEPDSEAFRNISVCPKLWHMKETIQILKTWGYSGEEHIVVTEDGYILSLFRIITPTSDTRPPPNNDTRTQAPVLFIHGFLASPETFILRGKEDLPLMLADEGFDVWFATLRGTHYGRRHVNLTTEDQQFWDFTFHEHGYFDLPPMIDHILQVTKTERVSCIGHSMGNAVFMVMLALRPEYNEKVQMFVGIAPYAKVRMAFPPQSEWLLETSV